MAPKTANNKYIGALYNFFEFAVAKKLARSCILLRTWQRMPAHGEINKARRSGWSWRKFGLRSRLSTTGTTRHADAVFEAASGSRRGRKAKRKRTVPNGHPGCR